MTTRKQIEESDTRHPDFKNSFFEKYSNARAKSGLTVDLNEDQKQDGFMRYLVQDVSLPGIDENDDLITSIVDKEIDLKEVNITTLTEPLNEETPSKKKVYEDDE